MEENRTEDKFDHLTQTKLAYRIETREDRPPADAVVSFSIDVQGLRTGINRDMAKLHRM